MTQEEILKGNKLIAEFLYRDLGLYEGDDCDCWIETPEGYVDFYITDALYHKSLDWLLPVINKIKNNEEFSIISNYEEGWEVDITTTGYQYITQVHQKNNDLILACFLVCVQYIEKCNNKTLIQPTK
jgi:hypothetical protein